MILASVLAFGFPLLTLAGYATLYLAVYQRRADGGRSLDRHGFYWYPVFLAIPLAAALGSGPVRHELSGLWSAPAGWIAGGLAIGAALFFAERFIVEARGPATGSRAFLLEGRSDTWRDLKIAPAVYLVLALVVVVTEELVWRGVLLHGLTSRYGWSQPVALGASSAAFGLNHYYFGLRNVVYKWVFGAVWGLLLLASGSLLVPIGSHLAYEGLVGAQLLARGRSRPQEAPRAHQL